VRCRPALLQRLPFKFDKRGQFFIRLHNETPSIAAMCVSNPDRLPLGING
jgi:hypothetical protein